MPLGSSISRASLSYDPQGETDTNLRLMLLIDRPFLDTPCCGVRQMTWHLRNQGRAIGPKDNGEARRTSVSRR